MVQVHAKVAKAYPCWVEPRCVSLNECALAVIPLPSARRLQIDRENRALLKTIMEIEMRPKAFYETSAGQERDRPNSPLKAKNSTRRKREMVRILEANQVRGGGGEGADDWFTGAGSSKDRNTCLVLVPPPAQKLLARLCELKETPAHYR